MKREPCWSLPGEARTKLLIYTSHLTSAALLEEYRIHRGRLEYSGTASPNYSQLQMGT